VLVHDIAEHHMLVGSPPAFDHLQRRPAQTVEVIVEEGVGGSVTARLHGNLRKTPRGSLRVLPPMNRTILSRPARSK
jgi:hypothetical protein